MQFTRPLILATLTVLLATSPASACYSPLGYSRKRQQTPALPTIPTLPRHCAKLRRAHILPQLHRSRHHLPSQWRRKGIESQAARVAEALFLSQTFQLRV